MVDYCWQIFDVLFHGVPVMLGTLVLIPFAICLFACVFLCFLLPLTMVLVRSFVRSFVRSRASDVVEWGALDDWMDVDTWCVWQHMSPIILFANI